MPHCLLLYLAADMMRIYGGLDAIEQDLHDELDTDDLRMRRLVRNLRSISREVVSYSGLRLMLTHGEEGDSLILRLEPPTAAAVGGVPIVLGTGWCVTGSVRILQTLVSNLVGLEELSKIRRFAYTHGRTIPGSARHGARTWLDSGLRTYRLKLPAQVPCSFLELAERREIALARAYISQQMKDCNELLAKLTSVLCVMMVVARSPYLRVKAKYLRALHSRRNSLPRLQGILDLELPQSIGRVLRTKTPIVCESIPGYRTAFQTSDRDTTGFTDEKQVVC
jgi:hypothetical protein